MGDEQGIGTTDTGERVALPTERMIARIDGAIGWVTFNNPARRNAVSLDMWEALGVALDRFTADDRVRVIVLRGAGGRAFVSGADISQFEQQRSSPETIAHYNSISGRATAALADTPKPTIAMIEGWCIGGGVSIAVTCDLRVCGEMSKFGVPATRLGLGYDAAGVKKLMDLVGPAFTREIFYTARHFTAAEAAGMGLVNRIVPEADLEEYVRRMCEGIAQNAPLTIRSIKRSVAELSKGSPAADLELCGQLVRACFDSEDYIEGRRAFMEKRLPVFRGR